MTRYEIFTMSPFFIMKLIAPPVYIHSMCFAPPPPHNYELLIAACG